MKKQWKTVENRLVEYRCDCCDALVKELVEFPDATLFGRPMRLCSDCVSHFEHKRDLEKLATEMQLGIRMDIEPSEGLRLVAGMEQAFKESAPPEVDRLALCRLRFHFENQLRKRQ